MSTATAFSVPSPVSIHSTMRGAYFSLSCGVRVRVRVRVSVPLLELQR